MVLEVLSPGMEHAEQTDIGSKVLRVASHFEQRGCSGTEKQVIQYCSAARVETAHAAV